MLKVARFKDRKRQPLDIGIGLKDFTNDLSLQGLPGVVVNMCGLIAHMVCRTTAGTRNVEDSRLWQVGRAHHSVKAIQ